MQAKCSICGHANYAEMMAELKANIPRTSVSTKYGVSYAALSRCWTEHRPHDQEYEVAESIKRNQKLLSAALKAKPLDRMLVKDLEQRLSQLRSEQRALHSIRKEENPQLMDGGEMPLTIAALDAIIAQGPQYDTDGDLPIRRLAHKIETRVPKDDWKKVCGHISDLIDNDFAPSLRSTE
jgi:hypothetical protein